MMSEFMSSALIVAVAVLFLIFNLALAMNYRCGKALKEVRANRTYWVNFASKKDDLLQSCRMQRAASEASLEAANRQGLELNTTIKTLREELGKVREEGDVLFNRLSEERVQSRASRTSLDALGRDRATLKAETRLFQHEVDLRNHLVCKIKSDLERLLARVSLEVK